MMVRVMMTKTYIAVYLASLCAALLLTPLVIRIARALKLVDMPSLRKVHQFPVPRLGGIAIALAMLLAAVPALLFGASGAHSLRNLPAPILALLGGGAAMLLVGLLDDLLNLPAQLKLVAVILASLLLCAAGGRIEVLHFTEHGAIRLGWMAWPITVLWITLVTVSINFIDGLDGLAAGISAVVCGVITVLASSSGNGALAIVSLALLGSLTAFLCFNFNPARVFMGDCGSMFLGFTLGACSILCASQVGTSLGLALPAVALGIPLLDTVFTVIRRSVLERRSIFSAERGHIHHRLIDRGWSHRRAVLLLHATTVLAVTVGLLASHGRLGQSLTAGAAGLLVLLLLFHAAGAARAAETVRALKRNRGIRLEIRNGRRVFEGSQLSLRGASCFEEWWREVCEAARLLGARKLSFDVRERGGTLRTLVWQSSSVTAAAGHDAKQNGQGSDGTGSNGVSRHGADSNGNGHGHGHGNGNGNGNGHVNGNGKKGASKVASHVHNAGAAPAVLAVTIPVRHRRVGPPLRLDAEMGVENEFEGAGHRVALFARLMDECSLARLPGGSECIARPPRQGQKLKVKDRLQSGLGTSGSTDRAAGPKLDPEHIKAGSNGNGHAKHGDHNGDHNGNGDEKKNGDARRQDGDITRSGNGDRE